MLRALREAVAREGTIGLATVFALALALWSLITALSATVVDVISQRGGGDLTFHIGSTRISYYQLLIYSIALTCTVLAFWAVWRRESRLLTTCPACKSEIPAEATVCRYCSTELTDD